MSERRHEFTVGDRAGLEIDLPLGDVRITEGEAERIIVMLQGNSRTLEVFEVTQHGDTVVITARRFRARAGSVAVSVTVPAGMRLGAKLASADLTVEVALSEVRVQVASGDIRLSSITGPATIKAASGDVTIEAAEGPLDVSTASGDVRITDVSSDATIRTASGDVIVAHASADLGLHTAAGDVAVARYSGSDIEVRTMAGDVEIRFPAGRTLRLDLQTLSGDVTHAFAEVGEGSGDVDARIKTLAGDIHLASA